MSLFSCLQNKGRESSSVADSVPKILGLIPNIAEIHLKKRGWAKPLFEGLCSPQAGI